MVQGIQVMLDELCQFLLAGILQKTASEGGMGDADGEAGIADAHGITPFHKASKGIGTQQVLAENCIRHPGF